MFKWDVIDRKVMKKYKLYSYPITFLFALIFVGYPIITTLFLPNGYDFGDDIIYSDLSRVITVPYRMAIFFLSLIVIILFPKSKHTFHALGIYVLFWGLLLMRMFYDLFVRSDFSFSRENANSILLFMFVSCIIPVFAIIRGWRFINLRLAYKLLLFGSITLIPLFALNNPTLFDLSSDFEVRMSGNIALNSISFGHCGVTLAILAFCGWWNNNVKNRISYILCFIAMLVGVLITIKSGSRGPFVALLVCLFFAYFIPKWSFKSLLISSVLFILFFFYYDYILDYLSELSPVFQKRVINAESMDDITNGRAPLYEMAWRDFVNHPFIGSSFAIRSFNGELWYSHNVILDAFMGLGFGGGMLFIYLYYKVIKECILIYKNNSKMGWLSIITIQYIIGSLLSGCFYKSDMLNVCIVSILLFSDAHKHNNFLNSHSSLPDI